MSYSASPYGPPQPGSSRGRGGGGGDGFRGGRTDSYHGRDGSSSSSSQRDDQYQPQQGSPPLPPPDSSEATSTSSRDHRPERGSRPQYSRYGTPISEGGGGGAPPPSSSYQNPRGGMPPFQHGPPRPLMFVPAPHTGVAPGGPPPMAMGMVPMMVPHPAGGRGGGLHVQPPRGPPLVVVGGGFRGAPPPMQMMIHQHQQQAFQVSPPQPPLPQAISSPPLPTGWSEHYTPQGMQYFFNAATGVSTYERPTAAAVVVAAAVQAPATATENGSEDSSADAAGKWIEYKDDTSGQLYYHHTVTRETVWEQPEAYRMQQAREEVERLKKVALQEAVAAEAQAAAKKKQEAEQKAKMYDQLSRDERVALFKEFLEQKEISPQLKWQDAQRFISKEGLDKDPRWRFALTTAGEKKQSFAEYCTQAINKQSIERRRRVKKNREDFLDLLAHFESLFVPGALVKADASGKQKKSSGAVAIELDDVAENPHFYAVRQDARWLVIDDQKEKRSLFSGFMQDVVRKHAQLVVKQRDVVKTRFIERLREKADANEVALRGKRRLDATLKQQLWDVLQELRSETQGDKSVGDALKQVEKYDVYDWSEELLAIFRDEEYEARKRERELWKEREAQLLKELEEKLRAMVESAQLTTSTQWEVVRDVLLSSGASAVDASEENGDKAADGGESTTKRTPAAEAENQKLSERAQMRVFESIVKELRLALKPTLDVVSAFLSKASTGTASSGFEVHDACTYEAFADALLDGVKTAIDEKKPEDGEEEDESMEATTADGAPSAAAAVSDKTSDATAATSAGAATSPDALKQQRQDELETLVKSFTELEAAASSSSSSIEFPDYVREVYELLVVLAKEKKAAASAAAVPHPPALEKDKDGSSRSVRSLSRSRKRRRDDGRSLSPASHHRRSPSRSRSRQRARSPSRSRSRSKPLDRSVVWNTTSSSSGSKSKFMYDPLNGDDADMTLPKKPKRAPLTAEEESARAEEIIRQARLKLLAKQDAAAAAKAAADADGESELEDGEEPEEGEESEE